MPAPEPRQQPPAGRPPDNPTSPDDAPSRVVLHGAPRIEAAGRRFALQRKEAAIVAWLARHGPTPRSRLAGLFWPEVGEGRARGNLRQCLLALRRQAGELFTDADGRLGLAAALSIEPAAAGASWLDAYHYDDCSEFAAWLESERESQRARERQDALASIRAAARQGDLDGALRGADALLAAQRESEEAYRALMEVFYLRGDRAEAIAAWDRCREMLRQLYGTTPSEATQRLGAAILASAEATPARPTSGTIPATLLRPPRLIGRAGVIPSLVAAWQSGDAVLVGGEAGIGKSRVLAELVAAIGPAASVAARPGDAAVSYASLARLVLATIERFDPSFEAGSAPLVLRLLPQLAAALGAPEPEPLRTAWERRQAIEAVAAVFDAAARRGALAFVLDDLQFADAASLAALQALCERSGDGVLPRALLLGARLDELGAGAAGLLDALAAMRRLQRLTLAPLGQEQAIELVASLGVGHVDTPELALRLHRQLGGNPAFLLESMKLVAVLGESAAAPDAPLPPGIQAVIERRIGLLTPSARHIAELAAVAGDRFDATLAARALGLPLAELGEPLRELETRQVLYGRRFVHDIVAAAVERATPAAVGEFLHRFVAAELAAAGDEPAVTAKHWRAAGDWQRAGDAFRAAAARAQHASRPAETAAHLDDAAEAYERAGAGRERFAVLRERLRITLAPDFARSCLAQVERLEAAASDEDERLQALCERMRLQADHLREGDLGPARAAWERAHALGLDALAFEFAHPLAWRRAQRGEIERASTVLERSRGWALAQEDAGIRARFHTVLAGVLGYGDRIGEAIESGERALAELRASDDAVELLAMSANMALFRNWRGEFAAADALLVEARALRDRLHGRGNSLLLDLHHGAALRDLGRHDEAQALLEATRDELLGQAIADPALSTDLVVAENHLAQLWLARGDAVRALQALASDDAAVDARFRLRRTTLRLRAARLSGEAKAAVQALQSELAQLVALTPDGFNTILAELESIDEPPTPAVLARLRAFERHRAVRERPGLRLNVLARIAEAARALGREAQARQAAATARATEAGGSVQPYDFDARRYARAVAGPDG